jgi:hypothetical protein
MRRLLAALAILIFWLGCSENFDVPDLTAPEDNRCIGNKPPTLIDLPDTFVAVGDTVWLNPIAYDPDGDRMRYTCECTNVTWGEIKQGQIPVYVIDPITGALWFSAHAYDAPFRTFHIIVIDSCGASAQTSFEIAVL